MVRFEIVKTGDIFDDYVLKDNKGIFGDIKVRGRCSYNLTGLCDYLNSIEEKKTKSNDHLCDTLRHSFCNIAELEELDKKEEVSGRVMEMNSSTEYPHIDVSFEINGVVFPKKIVDWTNEDCLRLCEMIKEYNGSESYKRELYYPWKDVDTIVSHEKRCKQLKEREE